MSTVAHGYAAMAREDVADAKRRRAARSLEAYAAARGLERLGSGHPPGWAPALPRFAEEQQELLRGVLPGGRDGVLLHGLIQTHRRDEAGSDMPGSYWGVVVKSPPGTLRKALRPNRTWIPVLGRLFDDGLDDATVPFGVAGAWAPVTICATRVPEAVGRLDRLVLRTRTRVHRGRRIAADVGQLRVLDADGPALEAVLAGPARALLAELAGPYWEVRLAFGVLTIQRNGFQVEDAALDGLCRRVCALADALAHTLGSTQAAELDEPLAAPPWLSDPRLPGDRGWAGDAARTAAAHGLRLEDRLAWHEHHGHLPLPGRASIVLRLGRSERLLLCVERPVEGVPAKRPVLAVAAAPGAAPGPPGGVALPGARVLVQDGAALAWADAECRTVAEALDAVPALRAALDRAADR